jgi:homoserine dehydrogenase
MAWMLRVRYSAGGQTESKIVVFMSDIDSLVHKVTICGRLAGLDLDLSTLAVENIVPQELQSVASADEFMSKLPQFDEHFQKLNDSAVQNGEVLRYVGVVDVQGSGSGVKLVRYVQFMMMSEMEVYLRYLHDIFY